MKLVTFASNRGQRLGALVEGGVLDIDDAAVKLGDTPFRSLQALIEGGESGWDRARNVIEERPDECTLPAASVELLAPLPRPVRLRDACLFLEHMEKALAMIGREISPRFKEQIVYYNADNVHMFGHEALVPWPAASSWIDYELEWACVIGRPGVNIARDGAAGHIFGYTIFNDWSARDLQLPFMEANLGPGAGKDFANSLGPCIVTVDEVGDPYDLGMRARINGELWSNGSTSSMHWSFEEAIARLSEDRPLVAGEIIASGTVLGGCGFELDRRLAIGDRVELEVDKIGVLANVIGAA